MPGVLQNLNYLKRLMYHPCATPTIPVVLETMFQAALPQLLELEGWTAWDLDAKAYQAAINSDTALVQKNFGRTKHGRQLRALVSETKQVAGQGLATFAYELAAPLETAVFYMFVGGLAANFLADWATLMYEAEGCCGTNCYADVDAGGNWILLPGATAKVILGGNGTIGGVGYGGNTIFVPGGTECDISFNIPAHTWPNVPEPPAEWTMFLGDADENPIGMVAQSQPGGSPMSQYTPAGGRIEKQVGGRLYSIYIRSTTGWTEKLPGGKVHISVGRCMQANKEAPLMPRQLLPYLERI